MFTFLYYLSRSTCLFCVGAFVDSLFLSDSGHRRLFMHLLKARKLMAKMNKWWQAQNWKMPRSQINVFTDSGTLSGANYYRATLQTHIDENQGFLENRPPFSSTVNFTVSPVSIACRVQNWGCAVLRQIDLPN